MKSGFYIVDAVAHYYLINGARHSLCGADVVSQATPYDRREHLGVVPQCRQCQEAMRPAVAKAEVPVEKCSCYACAESSVRRAAKAEGA